MKKKKVITILGARPQFIKAAPLSRNFNAPSSPFEEVMIHTGQHFSTNMSEVFFQQLSIPTPKYNLDINSLGHGAMTGRMLEQIEIVLLQERPAAVMVYGDTNSTLAGALAAVKLSIPVIHIESGLRSFNLKMPEEINRILVDKISSLLFCPTETAIKNLKAEGIPQGPDQMVMQCGDLMLDSFKFFSAKARTLELPLQINTGPFVLVTIHRQENTEDLSKLTKIVEQLNLLHKNIPVVIALHPRTAQKIQEIKIRPKFMILHPQGYFETLQLLAHCQYVITDSGGLQKEAFFAKKLCFIAREETEWVELVQHHTAYILSDNLALSWELFNQVRKAPEFEKNLYGDGESAQTIIKSLATYLDETIHA